MLRRKKLHLLQGKTRLVFLLLLLIGTFNAKAQNDLRINEIMISNIDGYMVDYDFPDSWIELYNPTNKNINLRGYTLRLTTDITEEYSFASSKIIAAGEYLVICCDKGGKDIHTSFKLDSEGGTVRLINKDHEEIDRITYPSMLTPGAGYGRTKDDESIWQWEKTATPENANEGLFTDVLLPDPVFSAQGHVMSGAEEVTISLPSAELPEDTKIYITTNGEEPTLASQSATSFHLRIEESTVIRAKLISSQAISGPSVTQSYIFHPRKTALPIVSVVTDSALLFDKKIGIFSPDTVYNNLPNHSQNWRRPINVEYLGVEGETALFNQLGETALSGASSRKSKQKSLKIISNKRFGTKHFKGKLWEDKPSITENKSFLLRNGGSTTGTYRITDAFVQTLFGRHTQNLDWQAYTPAITYINGQFYGFCGLRERSDESYVWSNYDGEEDIDRVERLYNTGNEHFTEFENVFKDENSTYSDIDSLLDIDEFANYLAVEIFAANTDWPANNVSAWRKREGGKWRMITKDVDLCGIIMLKELTTDILNFNCFKYLTTSGDTDSQEYKMATRSVNVINRSRLFKKLLPMPEFEKVITDKLSVYLGDFLKPNISKSLLCNMRDEVYTELEATWKKHLDKKDASYFITNTDKVLSFMEQRPRKIYEHLADFYELGTVIPMTLHPGSSDVRINDISLTEGDFDGCYFSDRELRLNSGANNVGWKMTVFENEEVQEEHTFTQQKVALWLKDYAQCDSVSFETFAFDIDEFEQKLNELEIAQEACENWSNETDVIWDEPRYAYANITGIEALPTSKYDDLHAYIDLYDNNGNYMRKPVVLNLQGNSTPKVNLSVQFVDADWTDEDAPSLTFGNWVAQDEFHLKAFYEDGMQGTAEIAYKLYDQIIGVSEGARMTGDAFPMSLYVNGKFYGIMSWQLKKHRKNMDLAKDNGAQVWLDGKLNDKQLFGGTVNWTKFEVRNPKDLYNMDGTEYNGDYPQEIIDASSAAFTGKNKMKRCAEAKQHILELSQYCGELSLLKDEGATAEQMRAEIEQRFDTDNLIDYVVFSLVTNNYDGFSDNWQWYTRDGQRWAVAPYNCELTFGYNDEGDELWPAEKGSKKYDYHMDNAMSNGPMVWIRDYFWDDVKARYADLREDEIISADSITYLAHSWRTRIGEQNYNEESEEWPNGACANATPDSEERINAWIKERIKLIDNYLEFTSPYDINRDGLTTISDIAYLIKTLNTYRNLNIPYLINKCDVNKDGIISKKDIDDLTDKLSGKTKKQKNK